MCVLGHATRAENAANDACGMWKQQLARGARTIKRSSGLHTLSG